MSVAILCLFAPALRLRLSRAPGESGEFVGVDALGRRSIIGVAVKIGRIGKAEQIGISGD
jgi:hypothetical protein